MNLSFTPVRPTPAALAIRMSPLPMAAVALLLVPHPADGLVFLAAVGAVLVVGLPANAGALTLIAALVLAWTTSYGTVATPGTVRTVLFALAVYLVHVATAFAASVPLAAHVPGRVVSAWLLRCGPGVLVTVVVGVFVAAIGRPHGSSVLDVVGLLGALLATGAIVLLARLRG